MFSSSPGVQNLRVILKQPLKRPGQLLKDGYEESKATALLPFRKKPSDFTVWPLSGLTAAQQQHLVTEMLSLFTFVLKLTSVFSSNKSPV